MAFFSLAVRFVFISAFFAVTAVAEPAGVAPVAVAASTETREVLQLLRDLAGEQRLLGRHVPIGGVRNSSAGDERVFGGAPSLWSSDFGFAAAEDDANALVHRPELTEEALRREEAGTLLSLTYQQAHPVLGEPCSYAAGIRGSLNDQQWDDLLRPGTDTNKKWRVQMDLLAAYFKALESEKAVVIFRPYQGVNTGSYWWGAPGKERQAVQLWRMTVRYLTERQKVTNVLFAWSPSADTRHGLEEWYPGDEYVDLVAPDLRAPAGQKDPEQVFNQVFYERVLRLAQGRPVAIGAFTVPPTDEVLSRQPNWCWLTAWGEPLTPGAWAGLKDLPGVLLLKDLPEAMRKIREGR